MPRSALIVLSLLLAAAAPAMAQPMPGGPPAPAAPLDAAARRDLVEKLSQALRARYIFPDVADRAAARITAALAAGDYDALGDPVAFTARLSADLAAIAHDKHLHVFVMAAPPPPPVPVPAGPMPRAEAGITRADRLAGSIGYIEVIGFPPPDRFKPALDRAMAGLKGSRALIINARRNGGGMPASVAYLVSYLLPPEPSVVINDIVARTSDTTEFVRTSFRNERTPISFAGVPIAILTSKGTFSGGEEFAYDVQSLKRGTVIGEVTGGGANPTGGVPLGRGVVAAIPFGRSENPVTGTNWEGRGVSPDVAVAADRALAAALQQFGQKPAQEIAAISQAQVFSPRTDPLPGSEAALRRLIAGYLSGDPDYAAMTPQAADQVRGSLPQTHARLAALGALQSIRFRQPDMMGGDEFDVTFANGAVIMALVLDPGGRITAVGMLR
jgi:hypothetical protein